MGRRSGTAATPKRRGDWPANCKTDFRGIRQSRVRGHPSVAAYHRPVMSDWAWPIKRFSQRDHFWRTSHSENRGDRTA
eukprot:1662696-Alexandrium_andersonii.AAC.1